MCENKTTHVTKISGHTKATKFKLTYEWTIQNFSIIGKKSSECLKTPVFSAVNNDKVKWQLQLYPRSTKPKTSEYMSVFIQLQPNDIVKEIEADISIYICNKSRQTNFLASSIIFFTRECPTWGAIDFIKRSDLIKNDNYLPNDCLSIFCDITYCIDITTSTIFEFDMSTFEECNCKLQGGYKSLFNSQELTDVVLTASDKKLYAHQAILAAHSPVFLAMFNKDTKEKILNRVDIVDIDFNILQEMLRFIYCGTVQNIETIVNDLLIAADKYCITVLKDECEKYLCSKVCVDNVVELLLKADTHNALILRQYAINFFIEHKNELVHTNALELIGNFQPQTMVDITRGLILQ